MNELKPEDVMMALECCTKGCGWCKECPIGEGERCVTRLAEATLALLREKDAEIERLRAAAPACRCKGCRHLERVNGRVVEWRCTVTGVSFPKYATDKALVDPNTFYCKFAERKGG